jgi:hypothetical protein
MLAIIFCLMLAAAVGCFRTRGLLKRVAKRTDALKSLAAQPGIGWAIDDSKTPILSSNFMVTKPRDIHRFNIIAGSDWSYCDFSQAIYRKTRRGEYKEAEIYYSILQLDLARPLPTMLFDSPKTHRQQFKTYFDSTQIHHLEGNFDQYFTTYFPKYYSIDALSIITPEVMQAMIKADEFDVEIDGNKLYLYGPLVPVADLPMMINKGLEIRRKLMNNLLTYRDERLDAAVGRSGVSIYGTELRKNPYKGWTLVVGGAALVILYFVLPVHLANLLIYGLFFLVPALYGIWRQRRKNKQLDKQYALHMQFLENQKNAIRSL